MSRPARINLVTGEHPWKPALMPGSNGGVEVVPLASHRDDFALLVRFPPGFERSVPGGYRAAETFVVLAGELHLDGRVLSRGDLTHVPAHHVRGAMSSAGGCTALAWFSGPAAFLSAAELSPTRSEIHTLSLTGEAGAPLLDTPEALWEVRSAHEEECVDLDLTLWSLARSTPEGAVALVRQRR